MSIAASLRVRLRAREGFLADFGVRRTGLINSEIRPSPILLPIAHEGFSRISGSARQRFGLDFASVTSAESIAKSNT